MRLNVPEPSRWFRVVTVLCALPAWSAAGIFYTCTTHDLAHTGTDPEVLKQTYQCTNFTLSVVQFAVVASDHTSTSTMALEELRAPARSPQHFRFVLGRRQGQAEGGSTLFIGRNDREVGALLKAEDAVPITGGSNGRTKPEHESLRELFQSASGNAADGEAIKVKSVDVRALEATK